MHHLGLWFNIPFSIHLAYFLLKTSKTVQPDEWWFLSRFCLSQYNHWTKYRNYLLCRSWSPGSSFQDCGNQEDQSCGLHVLPVNILYTIQVVQLQQQRVILQGESSSLACFVTWHFPWWWKIWPRMSLDQEECWAQDIHLWLSSLAVAYVLLFSSYVL